ncbi:hypothetical protein I7I53_02359 [Histoplasma capsulatum var. duboisii H88]|uniref:Uncharacterized protein n=1 Tax=Ajellomyces capsulatus (strain H88) TaxID=544711 RepID=A0A8A1LK58_AJEC8|nr:hypothetical protein I7I53_02359 [Histoplasma capsulatum var. duboisii H88]
MASAIALLKPLSPPPWLLRRRGWRRKDSVLRWRSRSDGWGRRRGWWAMRVVRVPVLVLVRLRVRAHARVLALVLVPVVVGRIIIPRPHAV